MIVCSKCERENPYANEKCSICGNFLGFPNVNEAEDPNEIKALEERYQKAIESVKAAKYESKLLDFENQVKQSVAVINVDLDNLYYLLTKDNALYANYHLQTQSEIREFAETTNDKKRLGVDYTLFGSYANEIRDAALSLNNEGLESYGKFSVTLKELAIKHRASLLEENSYKFVKSKNIIAGGMIPPGYRTNWENRYKLAVAKLYKEIGKTNKTDYPKLILYNSGDRKQDEFIEVYIYGTFNKEAFEAVTIKTSQQSNDEMFLIVKDYILTSGIQWKLS